MEELEIVRIVFITFAFDCGFYCGELEFVGETSIIESLVYGRLNILFQDKIYNDMKNICFRKET